MYKYSRARCREQQGTFFFKPQVPIAEYLSCFLHALLLSNTLLFAFAFYSSCRDVDELKKKITGEL
jgi:hypothetical protein